MKLNSCIRILLVLALAITSASVFGKNPNPHPRPFWGSFEGVATFEFTDVCLGYGTPFQTLSDAEGHMTHMGRTMLSTSHCATNEGAFAVDGWAYFTAANGDQVIASYTAATVVPPPPQIVQTIDLVIVGGTGRFKNASGSLQGMVYIEFLPAELEWPLIFILTGWIVY